MAEFIFDYKERKIKIDVKECRNIFSKSLGLMFRKKSKPLLFIFRKPVSISIHSFFCLPFIAIWLDKNEIVDVKFVKPFRISIKPKEKFDKLLEIPSNSKAFEMISRR